MGRGFSEMTVSGGSGWEYCRRWACGDAVELVRIQDVKYPGGKKDRQE